MARVSFSEIERWETLQGIKRAETARRLNVTSQTLNGWRLRGRVSADESDRVRTIISASAKPESVKSVLGSPSEPELPENLSAMAKDCIARIAAAAARADGKFDDLLAHVAAEIERTVDLPIKSTKKVRAASKEQLSLVKTVSMMGGLIPNQQASAIDTMIWGIIRLEDPDASLPVLVEGNQAKKRDKAKARA